MITIVSVAAGLGFYGWIMYLLHQHSKKISKKCKKSCKCKNKK